MISGHMAAGLSLYHLDAQPIEQVSPLIQRQYLHGSQSTFTKWIMKKGAVVPLHHHEAGVVLGGDLVEQQHKGRASRAGDAEHGWRAPSKHLRSFVDLDDGPFAWQEIRVGIVREATGRS
jgi:hypothetical protein